MSQVKLLLTWYLTWYFSIVWHVACEHSDLWVTRQRLRAKRSDGTESLVNFSSRGFAKSTEFRYATCDCALCGQPTFRLCDIIYSANSLKGSLLGFLCASLISLLIESVGFSFANVLKLFWVRCIHSALWLKIHLSAHSHVKLAHTAYCWLKYLSLLDEHMIGWACRAIGLRWALLHKN